MILSILSGLYLFKLFGFDRPWRDILFVYYEKVVKEIELWIETPLSKYLWASVQVGRRVDVICRRPVPVEVYK